MSMDDAEREASSQVETFGKVWEDSSDGRMEEKPLMMVIMSNADEVLPVFIAN